MKGCKTSQENPYIVDPFSVWGQTPYLLLVQKCRPVRTSIVHFLTNRIPWSEKYNRFNFHHTELVIYYVRAFPHSSLGHKKCPAFSHEVPPLIVLYQGLAHFLFGLVLHRPALSTTFFDPLRTGKNTFSASEIHFWDPVTHHRPRGKDCQNI